MLKLSKEITGPKRYRRPLLVPMVRRMGRRILVALPNRVNALALFLALGGSLGASCGQKTPSGAPQEGLPDEAAKRGLVHVNRSGGSKRGRS